MIEEVRKPAKVEHRHVIDIVSNWFFFSWALLVIIVLGLFWIIANQRQTNNQFRENDLKYRYIKMQGQTDSESLYRLERQFRYSDSIKIISKQVEKYEELVKEQAERLERAKRNSEEMERLQRKVNELKEKGNE
jgi:biopolymer transport protein ExbB/TolQ